VICTDKTGTLTQNEMTVRGLWLLSRGLTVTGAGYRPEGRITEGGEPVPAEGDLRLLLIAGGLCNNSRVIPPDTNSPHWTVLGDRTEAAMKVAALKAEIDLDAEVRNTPRLRELPFNSVRKRMCTIHQMQSSRVAYVKGAPREILGLCSRIRFNGENSPMDENFRAEIMAANDAYARNGLRVLAVALRELSDDTTDYRPEIIESNLTFLGLEAMMDPPRDEVAQAVETCHRAGIRIIMITGDYGLTAESIARRIGIIRQPHPRIISGADIDAMDDETLKSALNREVIFARATPEHKLRVVTALQETGHIVAVTGDGVNDAPALRKADIGVAMGIAGTDVAKEAADIILTDDNFASIVNAVEEGRGVYANIKKFISYIFTSNTPEAVPFIFWALSRGRIPLALGVMHILAIDLGTDMVPALALGEEPPEPGLMDRPPRDLGEHVITRSLLVRAYLFLGIIQSFAAMAAFYFQYWMNGYWGQWLDLPSTGVLYESATAMTLGAVVATQIGNLFAQRTERTSVFKMGWFSNRMIWIGIASELLLISLIVYVPFFQQAIGTAAFPLGNWLFLFAWTPSLLLADELRKALVRRSERTMNIVSKPEGVI
jgi:magnesium-transporting ATPase (P-type)